MGSYRKALTASSWLLGADRALAVFEMRLNRALSFLDIVFCVQRGTVTREESFDSRLNGCRGTCRTLLCRNMHITRRGPYVLDYVRRSTPTCLSFVRAWGSR